MANAKDIFIMCFALSCVGNVISDPSDIRKNHEEMMGPNAFETIEKMVAEMVKTRVSEMVEARVAEIVDIRVAEMVETRVAEMVETRVAEMVERKVAEMVETRVAEMVNIRVAEMVDIRVAEMVETRVVQEMSKTHCRKVKDEIKKELAFDMREECKNINERDENDLNKRGNFDNITNEDMRQHLRDELMTELNQSISSAVPRAVRDLPYLVTCAYQGSWQTTGRMSYDYLLTDWNNGDHVNGGHGVLDVSTGVFTAGTPGHYTATISGYTTNTESSDSHSLLYMYLNGQQVDETLFASGYHSGGQYLYYDQGSRTMIFHMNEGDTLHIEATQASSSYWFSRMVFCISLTAWDY